MRFWWTIPVLMVGLNLGWGQTTGYNKSYTKDYKVRASTEFKIKDTGGAQKSQVSVPAARIPSNVAAKNIQGIEHETVKGSNAHPKKVSVALPTERNRPNPRIDFKGSGEGKGSALTGQGTNPLRGRLKEKGNHH
jgi:hypothetical protein